MDAFDLTCREERRRDAVQVSDLYGLDYVEVDDTQRRLEVFFLGAAPKALTAANVRISGGRRVTDIRIVNVEVVRRAPEFDDYLDIVLGNYGDFSTYTLSLVERGADGQPTDVPMAGFDPRYRQVSFTFKASCPTDLDCNAETVCPPTQRPEPEINYLAKDYASFRQLILDRLALVMPDWRERHVPDIGIMLVELLAYVGDDLSYYQDAIATEAYLDTARQRISVRRHARLVDYLMHEGCNARAWVTIKAEADTPPIDPKDIYFCTAYPGAPKPGVLHDAEVRKEPADSYVAFSPLLADPIRLYAAHSEIRFYTWGDCDCCLPAGATGATLVDQWTTTGQGNGRPKDQADGKPNVAALPKPANDQPDGDRALQALKPGDYLVFEEVIGPKTGVVADADPRHRQVVQLTKVTPGIDPLNRQPVVEIEWCLEDALAFPLCISARMPPPDCDCRDGISVARGNVALVDNCVPVVKPIGTVGTQSSAALCPTDCSPGEIVVGSEKFRPAIADRPLTFSQPLPPCGCAIRMTEQDPRKALPRITLTGTLPTPPGLDSSWTPQRTAWAPKFDLLESGPGDAHFVVEIDDEGVAHLRFGDGDEGLMPDAGTSFEAAYRIGNGPGGNVGAEAIRYIVFRDTVDFGALTSRNPLSAVGGTAPELVAEVKMLAPHAFRTTLERAITADDYAALAADNSRRLAERHDCAAPFHGLQAAKGALRWTGSWYEAAVAVDPLGTETADEKLFGAIDHYLERYRRVGHDLSVALARFVPIDLALTVCVQPHALRGQVESALLDVFSDRALADGRLGFFHPDNVTFDAGIYASRIIAAAQGVSGVMEIELTRLARYHVGATAPDGAGRQVPASGVLVLAPFEIAQLGADPNVPENGRLTLLMRGGR